MNATANKTISWTRWDWKAANTRVEGFAKGTYLEQHGYRLDVGIFVGDIVWSWSIVYPNGGTAIGWANSEDDAREAATDNANAHARGEF